MSDLISRQAAIDALLNLHGMVATDWHRDKDYFDAVSDAIAMLRNLPSVQPQRWIPVTERLPEEDGQYLITVKYVHEAGYDDIYAEHGEWIDGKWDMFCFGHCGKVESITAWMQLPEPYTSGADMRGTE